MHAWFPAFDSMNNSAIRLFLILVLSAGAASNLHAADALADFQAQAAKFNAVLTVPTFERTPAEIEKSVADTLAAANAALDKIGKQDLGDVAFATTVGALDDANYPVTSSRSVWRSSSRPARTPPCARPPRMRPKGCRIGAWPSTTARTFTRRSPPTPNSSRNSPGKRRGLLAQTVRDYRRAGMQLAPPERQEVERMRKELRHAGSSILPPTSPTRPPPSPSPARNSTACRRSFWTRPRSRPARINIPSWPTRPFQYVLVEENAKTRGDPQEALRRPRQHGEGQERPAIQPHPRAAQRHRPQARVQDLGTIFRSKSRWPRPARRRRSSSTI